LDCLSRGIRFDFFAVFLSWCFSPYLLKILFQKDDSSTLALHGLSIAAQGVIQNVQVSSMLGELPDDCIAFFSQAPKKSLRFGRLNTPRVEGLGDNPEDGL
jgi:hypothetical protein